MHNKQFTSINILLTLHSCARLSPQHDTSDHICIAIITHISSSYRMIATHPLPDNIFMCLHYHTTSLCVASQSPDEINAFILKSKVVMIVI